MCNLVQSITSLHDKARITTSVTLYSVAASLAIVGKWVERVQVFLCSWQHVHMILTIMIKVSEIINLDSLSGRSHYNKFRLFLPGTHT